MKPSIPPRRADSTAFCFNVMEATYSITFNRGRKRERYSFTSENGDLRVRDFVAGIFRTRTRKPEKLSIKDGVKMSLVRTSGEAKCIIRCRIYNRSVKQAASEFVKSVQPYIV